jgi:UDP-N-acetylmuramate dehydrogenase
VVLDNNEVKEIPKDDITYSYRYTSFKDNKNTIILGAYFKLRAGNEEESKEIVNRRMKKRLETQPLDYPSAGSVFRNPEGDFAGRIIEEDLGYKGKSIGGAKISEKHANFIINYDNATGSDIRKLINLIKEEVKKKDDIDLIVEQEFIDWE